MHANGTTFALSCFLERPMSTQLVIDHVLRSETEAVIGHSLERWFEAAKTLTLKMTSAPAQPTLTGARPCCFEEETIAVR